LTPVTASSTTAYPQPRSSARIVVLPAPGAPVMMYRRIRQLLVGMVSGRRSRWAKQSEKMGGND
jgi:hypothetical protein